jgi:hypothetical protein
VVLFCSLQLGERSIILNITIFPMVEMEMSAIAIITNKAVSITMLWIRYGGVSHGYPMLTVFTVAYTIT